MPAFQDIFKNYQKAQSLGAISSDAPLSEFARLGALATRDPTYAEVANSGDG